MGKSMFSVKSLPVGVKASIAFFFASIIANGISYIVTPIYTRLLSPAEFGKTSIFLTWVQIFGILAMFCLSYGVFNNGMLDYPERRNEFSFSLLILSNIITIVFGTLLLVFYSRIGNLISVDIPLILLMLILFIFQPAYNFWMARQRYEYKYKWTFVWSTVSALASPIIAVICISQFQNKVYGRLFGAEITLIVIYIGFYIFLAAQSKFKVNTKYWKGAILFNLPLIPHYLSAFLLGNSNKIIISFLVNDSATAYFSVAYSVAAIGTIVWSAANSSLIPYTYEKCKDRNFKAISDITSPILFVFAVVCVLVMMMAPEVVSVLAPENYLEAIYVIPPIVVGMFFQIHYYIYANIIYYYKKPRFVMYASLASVIFNFVVSYFSVKLWGYLAAGYAIMISYLLQATLDFLALKRVVKEPVYDMKLIFFLSVLLMVIAIISQLLFSYFWVRLMIVFLIGFGVVYSRKKIFGSIFLLIKNR